MATTEQRPVERVIMGLGTEYAITVPRQVMDMAEATMRAVKMADGGDDRQRELPVEDTGGGGEEGQAAAAPAGPAAPPTGGPSWERDTFTDAVLPNREPVRLMPDEIRRLAGRHPERLRPTAKVSGRARDVVARAAQVAAGAVAAGKAAHDSPDLAPAVAMVGEDGLIPRTKIPAAVEAVMRGRLARNVDLRQATHTEAIVQAFWNAHLIERHGSARKTYELLDAVFHFADASRLRYLRKRRGWSRPRVEERLGWIMGGETLPMSERNIGFWETGHRKVFGCRAALLAKVYGVPEECLYADGPPIPEHLPMIRQPRPAAPDGAQDGGTVETGETGDAAETAAENAPQDAGARPPAKTGRSRPMGWDIDYRAVQRARENAGLTRPEMVERLNEAGWAISKHGYSNWEGGSRRPSTGAIQTIARVLDMPVDQIVLPGQGFTTDRERPGEAAAVMIPPYAPAPQAPPDLSVPSPATEPAPSLAESLLDLAARAERMDEAVRQAAGALAEVASLNAQVARLQAVVSAQQRCIADLVDPVMPNGNSQ